MKINCALTRRVIDKLQEADIDCYIVGGYVRDKLLGVESKDIDIELHNASFEQVFTIINNVTPAKAFGTFGIIALNEVETEFALARTERKSGVTHTDFEVDFITDGNLQLAANRRDFTINSMMYDLQNDKLIDLFGGQQDLQNKVLRHVSPAFSEDPLRVLRGLKFIARYDLKIAAETDELCVSIIDQIAYLPKIRIENELEAIFEAKYFQSVAKLLTTYINIIFKDQLLSVQFRLDSDYNKIMFFKQFLGYEQVLDFCYEQKKLKKDLKFVLDNFDDIQNFKLLSGDDKFKLLSNIKYTQNYVFTINQDIKAIYEQFLKLKVQYDGNYFLNLGISGKQIATKQKQVIGEKLDEL